MLLGYNVSAIAFDLVNHYVDVAGEKPFRWLLDVNEETIHGLVKLVLWFWSSEYLVELLAQVLMMSKVMLDSAFKLECQVETVVAFVEFVAQF